MCKKCEKTFEILHSEITLLMDLYISRDCKNNIRIHYESEGGIEKYVSRITDWHHEASRMMTNADCERWIFLSHPHMNNGFFFLLTTKYCILY